MECDSLMIAELDVKTLSRTDKLRLLESLWADLSAEDASITSPAWRGDALKEAEKLHAEGSRIGTRPNGDSDYR